MLTEKAFAPEDNEVEAADMGGNAVLESDHPGPDRRLWGRHPSPYTNWSLRAYLRARALDSLAPLLKGIFVIYVGLAVSHWLILPAALAAPLSLAAAAAAAFSLAALHLARRTPAHVVNAHFVGGAVAAMCLLNTLLHLQLTRDPQQTSNLLLLLVSVGAVTYSRFVAYGSATLGVGIWVLIATDSWNGDWSHQAFGIVMALAVMGVSVESRLRLSATLFRTEQALKRQASIDELTGLPNRFYRLERLQRLLDARQCERGVEFGICFVDADGLKTINDVFGHAAGDGALQALARRLRENCRSGALEGVDVVGRLGGDEFVVILEDIASKEELDEIVARFEAAVRQEFDFDGRRIPISASVGGVWSREFGQLSIERLLTAADERMYRHKSGRAIPSRGAGGGSPRTGLAAAGDFAESAKGREPELTSV